METAALQPSSRRDLVQGYRPVFGVWSHPLNQVGEVLLAEAQALADVRAWDPTRRGVDPQPVRRDNPAEALGGLLLRVEQRQLYGGHLGARASPCLGLRTGFGRLSTSTDLASMYASTQCSRVRMTQPFWKAPSFSAP